MIKKSIFFLLGTLLLFTVACDDVNIGTGGGDFFAPSVVTDSISELASDFAIIAAEVTSDGGAEVTKRGVVWAEQPVPSLNNAFFTEDGTGEGEFTSTISGLESSTLYYVRAYATNSIGTAYGSQLSFTTKEAQEAEVPNVRTVKVEEITSTTAEITAEIISSGGSVVTEKGFVWDVENNPDIELSTKIQSEVSGDIFSEQISGLNPETTYFVRAYAINEIGVAYGEELSFTTESVSTVNLPEVISLSIENITETSATFNGNLISDGGGEIIEKGFTWGTQSEPNIDQDNKTNEGSSPGFFSSSVTGLEPGETYYVRAYATNEAGTAYGEEMSFETISPASIPMVNTADISNLTSTSASSGGNVTDDGGSNVFAKGVVWGTQSSPTIDTDFKTEDGSGEGPFQSTLTDLEPGTNYFLRAYASNDIGTAYGQEIEFTTPEEDGGDIPTVTTANVIGITSTGAISGGNVTDDGGSPVTARGVVWSLNPNPSLGSSSFTTDGSGRGSFVSVISNLIPSTKYYIRAYATNANGTAYGPELEFTTANN